MKKLRIAVYYPWVYLTSGAERTLVELAKRSRHEIVLFTSRFEPESTFPEFGDLDLRVVDRVSVHRSPRNVALSAVRILVRKLDLRGFDALLVCCEGLGDLVALRNRDIPAFNLCLTPLRIVFDPLYRETYMRTHGAVNRAVVRGGGALFRWVDRLAWRRYTKVFPISDEVRRRILLGRLAPAEKLQTIHPGVDVAAFEVSTAAERTFLLPGRIMWTKNVELAIEAFRLFRERVAEPETWRLRIAGIVDEKSLPYLEKLRGLSAGDPAVEFCIHPADETMRAFYRDCYALLFTAFNEDWGLVLLEGMACGKTAVAVNRGGPREIVQNLQNGLLVEPDPASFAAAMLRLAENGELHASLAACGPATAARFSWKRFVDELDSCLESELGNATASEPVVPQRMSA